MESLKLDIFNLQLVSVVGDGGGGSGKVLSTVLWSPSFPVRNAITKVGCGTQMLLLRNLLVFGGSTMFKGMQDLFIFSQNLSRSVEKR